MPITSSTCGHITSDLGARRKALHEGIIQSPHEINVFITSYLEEIQMMARLARVAFTSVAPANNRWLSSPVSFLKVNVDATVGQSGTHGAVAAMSRD